MTFVGIGTGLEEVAQNYLTYLQDLLNCLARNALTINYDNLTGIKDRLEYLIVHVKEPCLFNEYRCVRDDEPDRIIDQYQDELDSVYISLRTFLYIHKDPT